MSKKIIARHDAFSRSNESPALGIPAAALSIVTIAAFLHPNPLVLVALSTILVVAGFGLAAIIALRRNGSPTPIQELLYLPALIVFFGFAATILGDPDAAVMSLQR